MELLQRQISNTNEKPQTEMFKQMMNALKYAKFIIDHFEKKDPIEDTKLQKRRRL
jgi:hypothetical protein